MERHDHVSVTGGCLCGGVRYAINGEPSRTVVCHCTHCQKQSGSAFSINLMIPAQAFSLDGKLKEYCDRADSGGTVVRQFCGDCGSPILSQIEGRPDFVFLKAGTLDNVGSLSPDAHIWTCSAQSWVERRPDTPSFSRGFD